MDERQFAIILDYIVDLKSKERIINKLDIAEAVYYGNRASEPKPKNQSHKGIKAYNQWRKRHYRLLFPADKRKTVWDILPKNKKGKAIKLM